MSFFDMDQDGTADAVVVDRFGDGVADVIGFDTDENGIFEAMSIDGNNDGVIDTYVYDTNQDNIVNVVAYDVNEDGAIDSVVHDDNQNSVDDATEQMWPSSELGVIGGAPDRSGTPLGVVELIAGITNRATFGTPDRNGDGYDDNEYVPRD